MDCMKLCRLTTMCASPTWFVPSVGDARPMHPGTRPYRHGSSTSRMPMTVSVRTKASQRSAGPGCSWPCGLCTSTSLTCHSIPWPRRMRSTRSACPSTHVCRAKRMSKKRPKRSGQAAVSMPWCSSYKQPCPTSWPASKAPDILASLALLPRPSYTACTANCPASHRRS